jgi:NAD(P)-dependent dehydrogenase (short-subunit alcohol dehydrogenase family)
LTPIHHSDSVGAVTKERGERIMSQSIIVTGGAGGIGSEICRGMAADGLKVVVADYAKEAAEKVAAEIRDAKGDAIAAKVDVGNPQSVAEMMAQAIAKYGERLRLAARASWIDAAVDMPEEEWDQKENQSKGVFPAPRPQPGT